MKKSVSVRRRVRRMWRGLVLGVLTVGGLQVHGCFGQLNASARDGLWALYDRSVNTIVDVVADRIENEIRN
jgi:hypothetical protein